MIDIEPGRAMPTWPLGSETKHAGGVDQRIRPGAGRSRECRRWKRDSYPEPDWRSSCAGVSGEVRSRNSYIFPDFSDPRIGDPEPDEPRHLISGDSGLPVLRDDLVSVELADSRRWQLPGRSLDPCRARASPRTGGIARRRCEANPLRGGADVARCWRPETLILLTSALSQETKLTTGDCCNGGRRRERPCRRAGRGFRRAIAVPIQRSRPRR